VAVDSSNPINPIRPGIDFLDHFGFVLNINYVIATSERVERVERNVAPASTQIDYCRLSRLTWAMTMRRDKLQEGM